MKLIDLYESQLNEIERLTKTMYTGGKKELDDYKAPGGKQLRPLPGGSGFMYAIEKSPYGGNYIFIVDPAYKPRGKIVAKLSIDDFSSPIPNSVQVGAITVDEDYRGHGLAKALYGIVLTIMKKTLIAGSSQTPGGRRNWMSLANIPGVEVKGFVQIDDDEANFDPTDYDDADEIYAKRAALRVDKIHDAIMQLGGQFIGKNKYSEFWAFDVMPGDGELTPAVKNSLSKLYSNSGYEQTGLIARWVG